MFGKIKALFGFGDDVQVVPSETGTGSAAAAKLSAAAGKRRNSLAYEIVRFVTYEDDDFGPLIDNIKSAEKISPGIVGRLEKVANAIQQGNMRELRNQVVGNFKAINRPFKQTLGGNSMLHLMCQEGFYEMLEFLFNPVNHPERDDVPLEVNMKNNKNRTPLLMCFTPPTKTYLGLKYGVKPDGNCNSERPDGIEIMSDWILPGGPNQREKCIQILLNNGANPNFMDLHSFFAIHYASMYGWTSVVKFLIERGADGNAQTIVGKSPLMYAVEYQYESLVQFLTQWSEIQLNLTDSEGITALFMAIDLGEDAYEICRLILKAGADPDCMTNRKKTPLMIACQKQSIKLVYLLLDYKCQRDPSSFAFLDEENQQLVQKRIEAEDKKAQEEAERQQEELRKKAMEGMEMNLVQGHRNKVAYGAWVEYNDKRGRGIFYYNPVSRASQWQKPHDFVPNKDYIVKDATFGMHFYH